MGKFEKFKKEIEKLAAKVIDEKELYNEQETVDWLIKPLLQALGYDNQKPREVVPQNITLKKERLDYAIKIDGKTVIIIECKRCTVKTRQGVVNPYQLTSNDVTQLVGYFNDTPHKENPVIAILTNGNDYWFYTATPDYKTQMDGEPYFEIKMQDLKDKDEELKELWRYRKGFKPDKVHERAIALKSKRDSKRKYERKVEEAFNRPSNDFIDHLTKFFAKTKSERAEVKEIIATRMGVKEQAGQAAGEAPTPTKRNSSNYDKLKEGEILTFTKDESYQVEWVGDKNGKKRLARYNGDEKSLSHWAKEFWTKVTGKPPGGKRGLQGPAYFKRADGTLVKDLK